MPTARVLIANRGEIARRLIRQFREMDFETVSVFSEPDVEQPFVDEADYSVFLGGRTVSETYLVPEKIVSAALDAGCDLIHPGYCFLAERLDFLQLAVASNVSVIGADPSVTGLVVDRFELWKAARHVGIPLIPSSGRIGPGDDPGGAAATVGFPLFVKAVEGGALLRVDAPDHLAPAVAAVRAEAARVTGDARVYLERCVDAVRHVNTLVVADGHGAVVHFGSTDSSLQVGYRSWLEELGEVVSPELHRQLGDAAVKLCRAVGWRGVGRVRWLLTPDGGWYLLGFSARLTTGYTLAEQVHGIDLVQTQYLVHIGEHLGWEQEDTFPKRHGIQIRVLHVGADGRSRPDGEIGRIELPAGVLAETGTAEGQPCTPDTDPLLVKLTITGATRHAALVRAKAALDDLVIEGVQTNLGALRELLGSRELWERQVDVRSLPSLLDRGDG